MDNELDFNETIGEPQRNCDECGKLDDTAFCRNDHYEDDKGEHLCFDCAGENGSFHFHGFSPMISTILDLKYVLMLIEYNNEATFTPYPSNFN